MQKKTFPDFVPPMMAQSAKEAFDSPDWIFEIKLDGYRAITVFDAAGKPHLWSRNGLPLEQKFPAILKAVSRLKLPSTVLDGEIVAVDENGIPRFQLLQRFQKQPTAPTLYFVFDVLWSNGTDITRKTLMERRAVLETIIKFLYGHCVATLEIMVGLFGLAVMTGLIFVRFSRPTARIKFSEVAVVAPFNGL